MAECDADQHPVVLQVETSQIIVTVRIGVELRLPLFATHVAEAREKFRFPSAVGVMMTVPIFISDFLPTNHAASLAKPTRYHLPAI